MDTARRAAGHWRSWLKSIERELVTVHAIKRSGSSLRGEIVAKRPNADGTWLVHYSTIYAKTQMVAIRKLSMNRPRTSLGQLVRGLHDRPDVLTRARYERMHDEHSESVRESFDRYADPADPDRVDHRQLHEHYESLSPGLDTIIERVNRTIAHADKQLAQRAVRSVSEVDADASLPTVTYGDIRTAIDTLATVANHYLAMFFTYSMHFTPTRSRATGERCSGRRCSAGNRSHPRRSFS